MSQVSIFLRSRYFCELEFVYQCIICSKIASLIFIKIINNTDTLPLSSLWFSIVLSLYEKSPNTEIFLFRIFPFLDWIQKTRTRKTPYFDTFQCSYCGCVCLCECMLVYVSSCVRDCVVMSHMFVRRGQDGSEFCWILFK